jgi:DNA (cytosine-5)-methyltransferase 1
MAPTPEGPERGRFSVVSLFTGAGGLDVGLDRTGRFRLLAAAEIDPVFCATLRDNQERGLFGTPETQVLTADLSRLDPYELMDSLGIEPGELDLLVGGPPCQSFSTAGRRKTVADPRGQLIWHYLRFVEAFRPRYFVMENVRGLLSAALRHRPIALRPDKGGPPLAEDERPGSAVSAWAEDLATLDGGSYRVDCFEVNAVNYGAPQLRERVLFVGNRSDRVVEFPEPTHGPGPGLEPYGTLRQALAGLVEDEPVLMDFSPRKKRYLGMVPAGGNWRALPPEVARESMGRAYVAKGGRSGWWRRLSWDLPCPTIVTLPNHASTSMCHPDEVRVLSVGECARVQEFPDGWRFAGSPQQQMTQVGNAVPTRLGLVVGRLVADLLDADDTAAEHTVDDTAGPSAGAGGAPGGEVEALPRFRRVYLSSHVRTRQWWKSGTVYLWDGPGGDAEYGAWRQPAARTSP